VGDQLVEFGPHVANFQLGFQIHPTVILSAQTISSFLAILAHHNDRRLQSSKSAHRAAFAALPTRVAYSIEKRNWGKSLGRRTRLATKTPVPIRSSQEESGQPRWI
jgi:hypothetical protein